MTAQHGVFFVVRCIKIDYAAAARLDESLAVVTRPMALGTARVRLRQSFFRDGAEKGRPLVAMEVELACVGRAADGNLRPVRLPQRWRERLAALNITGS
jgi:acyl-CoA thioesterase FadM